ncbi:MULTISPECIES: hypothetical protein [unclassified Streptomyces]|jgi:hypothetical protein|uniref:hypothetical protein n=1 Tax=unclassified Streptomyces TaxID=2593676 RepID=UPI00081B9E97|nr:MULTISPECIES: hypothetical protein [unclassified Streptomyces]MYQ86936.1 hypothetical protein [Streptomyces sp. SID4936]SCE38071.1 hypothetical protein GA0115234_10828 [Streptomyces sp. DvalAA-43]
MTAPPDLAATDDIEFGVRLLAATPTHEGRDRDLLRHWATVATEFGARLGPVPSRARVVERDGGLAHGLLARYTSRPATVELYTDTLARAEALVDERGWRHWYPAGSVRAAALAHEAVHELLHHGPAKAELKHALGHVVLRAGRRRLYGHVAGAEEIAAHAHARTVCGLGRSPLLLTAALATADTHPVTAPHGREK